MFEIILKAAGLTKPFTSQGRGLLPYLKVHSFAVLLLCDPMPHLVESGANILCSLLETRMPFPSYLN